jgi:hypothetical protein
MQLLPVVFLMTLMAAGLSYQHVQLMKFGGMHPDGRK